MPTHSDFDKEEEFKRHLSGEKIPNFESILTAKKTKNGERLRKNRALYEKDLPATEYTIKKIKGKMSPK